MATLTGKKIKNTYKDLLQVSNSNAGIDSTLRTISDGEATDSVLQLSSSAVNISSAGALQYAGTAITSTAAELNILDGVTASTAELNILDGVTSTAAELNILDGADSSITTLSLPDNTTITTFGASLIDDADAATARTTLGIDAAGTDNSTNVTLVTTSHDYLSISGQAITLGTIDISDDTNLVGGDGLALTGDTLSVNVDDSSIEINSDTLRVKASGVTNAMLAGSIANAKLSNSSVSYGGVSVALGASDATPAFDLSDATSLPIVAGTTGTLSVARGGTGATTASGARTNLNVDAAGTDNSTDVTLVTSSHDYLSLSGQAITLGTIDIGDDTNLAGGTGIDLTGDTLSIDSTVATLTGSQTLTNKTLASPAFTGDIDFSDANTPKFTVTDTTNTVKTEIRSQDTSGNIGTTTDHNLGIIRNGVGMMTFFGGYTMHNNGGADIDFRAKDSSGNVVFKVDAGTSETIIGTLSVTGNASVTGDLTVNGTTTTVNQTNLDVSDNIIGLNRGASTNANDSGLIIERGSTGDNAAIIWDESADKFTLGTTTSTPSATGNLTVSTGTLVANLEGAVTGNADTATTLTGLTSSVAELNILDGKAFLDEDDMSSDSATGIASQQSIKAYVDDSIVAAGAGDITSVVAGDGLTGGTTSGDATLNVGAGTGIDVAADAISVDVSDFMSNGASGRVLRATGADTMSASTNVTIDGNHLKLIDDGRLKLGTGEDLQLYHDGSNNYIDSITSDQDLYIRGNDGGSMITAARFDMSDAGTLLPGNNIRMGDSKKIRLGSANDFNLYHDGSDSYIYNDTGRIIIQNTTSDGDIEIKVNDGGSTTNAIIIDASDNSRVKLPNDNQRLSIGASNDIQITHDGTNSYIDNYTGHLTIKSNDTDKDIILSSDDGSGGETPYITLDGSATSVNIEQDIKLTAAKKLYLDGGSDTYIHNPSGDTVDFVAGGQVMLRLFEGATDYVHIDDNVILGIGSGDDLLIYHDGTDDIINTKGNAFKFLDNGTERLRLTSAGNIIINENGNDQNLRVEGNTDASLFFVDAGTDRVGIGTNSPESKLNIVDSGETIIKLYASTASTRSGIWFTNGSYSYGTNIGTDNKFHITGNINSEGELVTVDSSGNVGIGTQSPSTKMHIKDASNNVDLRIETDKVNGNAQVQYLNDAKQYNVGVNNTDSWSVYDATVGATRFSINSSGHIELPNDNQYLKFGVGGDGVIYSLNDDFYISNFTAGQDTIFQNLNSASSAYVTNLFIDGSAERVGIGTSSPSFKLKVNVDNGTYTDIETIAAFQSKRGADSETQAGIMINSLGNALGGQISSNYYYTDNVAARGNTGRSGAIFGMANSAATGTHSSFYWQTSPNNSNTLTDRMILDNSGNLLIGTSSNRTTVSGYSPRLNTEGAGAAGYVQIVDTENSQFHGGTLALHKYRSGGIAANTELGSLYFGGTDSANSTYAQGALIKAYAQGTDSTSNVATDLAFFTNTGSAMTRAMTIDDSQNVGIGVTSPTSKLHVNTGTDISMDASGNGQARIEGNGYALGIALNGSGAFIYHNSSSRFLSFGTNETEQVRLTTGGALHVDNDVIAFSSTPSDKKLKTNVKDIEYGLDTIMKLKPKQYDWKEDNRHDIGFIAQEVEEVIPEIVKDNEWFDDKIKTLDYEKLTAVLIKAVQEQQQQINELKEKLNG